MNNKKILNLINKHTSVLAWISGYHHAGYYEEYGNIYHLTVKGLVEAQKKTSYGIEVYQDRLMFKGYGDQSSQSMRFSK